MKSVLASKACGPVNPARKMLALERTKKDRFINKNNDWTNQFESQPNPDFQEFNQVFEGSFTPVTFHQADFHPFQQNNLSEKHDEAFQEAFEQAIASTNEFEQAFDRAKATNEASYEFEEAFDRAKGKGKMNDWEQQFHEAINHLQINEFEDTWKEKVNDYQNVQVPQEFANNWEEDFDDFTSNPFNKPLPNSEYKFETNNPFTKHPDPFGEGMRLLNAGASLTATALAFEAAVLEALNSDSISSEQISERWGLLGRVQAENEKEEPALAALQNAVKSNSANLEALLGLSVSYTNEGYDQQAYLILDQWIHHKFPEIHQKNTIPITDLPVYEQHDRVRDLLLDVARNSQLDADVQVALGIVFYNSGQYDKAVDCFGTALKIRPQDYLLWNRLGATLANSGKSEEAIDAYDRALEIKPTFVRGLYNLGVSCMNIGCYKEAAEHFLSALSLHQVSVENPNQIPNQQAHNISFNLWDTLKRTFGLMERKDLMELCVAGTDVNVFKPHFQF